MIKKIEALFSIDDYNLSRKQAKIILFSPIVFTFLMVLLFAFSPTKSFARWLIKEDHPIEILTFIIFILGGVYGVLFSIKISKSYKIYIILFYFIFSIFLIIVGLEEASWGQRFIHFNTPENWERINMQGETNFHNIEGIHGRTEYLRFVFGFFGLCGIFLKHNSVFKYINVPLILIFWFSIITSHAILDILTDFGAFERFNHVISRFSEVTEFLISVSGFLYLCLNRRRSTNTDNI